jgi:hypothetical protein
MGGVAHERAAAVVGVAEGLAVGAVMGAVMGAVVGMFAPIGRDMARGGSTTALELEPGSPARERLPDFFIGVR